MADKETKEKDFDILSVEKDNETDSIVKTLLQLLPSPKAESFNRMDSSISGPLCNIETDNNGLCVESSTLGSPLVGRYAYNCPLLHQSSPSNLPSVSTYLPPIGVFWDIENCHVPRGRSATAATQLIREKFFGNYREAEFIVVCDVRKESSQVVNELNDAQVNLVHVAAQCKNAADEKLKQSIRRFADIHGSPAAIILISGDINFAADLSDLRYRKKIQVILLHLKAVSEALILCANEHYDFAELMESLPPRTAKVTGYYYDLLVSNLPEDQDTVSIKRCLKQLSGNCGGQVIDIQSSTAIVRFSSQISAVRAQKRMDGELVFGSKITVKFWKEKGSNFQKVQGNTVPKACVIRDSEVVTSSPRQMYSASASLAGGRAIQIPPYQSSSPVIGGYTAWNAHCGPVTAPTGIIQPPPVYVGRPYSSNSNITFNRAYNELTRVQSPIFWPLSGSQQSEQLWKEQYKVEKTKVFSKRIHIPLAWDTTVTNNIGPQTPDGLGRVRGTHTSFLQHPDCSGPRQPYHSLNVSSNLNGNCHSQSKSFKRHSPSPTDIQLRDHNQWNGQNQHLVPTHNTNASSHYEKIVQTMGQQNNLTASYHPNDAESEEEVEKFFNPINTDNGAAMSSDTCTPIELQVTNLDQSINPKKMRHMLTSIFLEHVMVLNVSTFTQSDGNFAASVEVPSLADAQYAISQLHRRKIGYKRILISYAHSGRASPQVVRAQIVMLLQEVPGHKLPLFKFREMYESRFIVSISISELYKMKDVCIVTEDPDGRMVSLNPDHRNTPSPCLNNATQEEQVGLPYCTIHTLKPWSDKGWAEQKLSTLPNVKVSLKVLGPRIHQLLTTHNGSLPLPSLPNCYEAEFKEKLQVLENGVPLEHLMSCLPRVELKQGIVSVKYLTWAENKSHETSQEESKCVSPSLANQSALFSRELVDLLKTAPHCQILFNRFIPAYHHHFGRQCRVADYGFTKLIDLLEALAHTVQVIGEGNNRVVTLSHRAQIRRFTSDLLRVLKSKASKQVTLSEFPSVYNRVIGKPWDVVDYGVCELEDMLSEVSENTVVVTNINGGDKMISIPKREQTAEDIERTRHFAVGVVELLRHAPHCRMLFNKFVPSYHHHFGHQCRVSDYGFTKLIELFEAIPDVVKIEDDNGSGEREISLTEEKSLCVLSEQISKLIFRSKGGLSVSDLSQSFLRHFGYALRPELFGCNSVLQLIEKLKDTVKIKDTPTGPVVVKIDISYLQRLSLQCRRILMNQPQRKMTVKAFQQLYVEYYLKLCNINDLKQKLSNVVLFTTKSGEQYIELTPLHGFACDVYRVMVHCGGSVKLSQFEAAHLTIIGSACNPAQYGFSTLLTLLQALPCTVTVKVSRRKRNIVYVNKILATVGIPLPPSCTAASSHRDMDSSSESNESESSSRKNISIASATLEENKKRSGEATKSPKSWKQIEESSIWPKQPDKRWNALFSGELESHTEDESFFKNFIHTPMSHGFVQSAPKPDTPPKENACQDHWESSVWAVPTKFSYVQDEHTNVPVPPLTLPSSWNQIASDSGISISNLLSPAKNLLPATPNPLNPRTSPYFSSKGKLVVAPHPSELPLPSLSLTPKKHVALKNAASTPIVVNKQKSTPNNTIGVFSMENRESENTTKGSDSIKTESDDGNENRATPTKHLFTGKRRLAAQFNQPIES